MTKLLFGLVAAFSLCLPSIAAEAAKVEKTEMWKGTPPTTRFNLGAMGGLAIIGSQAGGVLLGSVAVKILNRGFVPDINNQVFVETQIGPVFINSMTLVNLNFHLRWDFHKDEDVSLYAIGGFGSLVSTDSARASSAFYPRFGLGAMWHLAMVSFRGEVSHESITAGAQFDF